MTFRKLIPAFGLAMVVLAARQVTTNAGTLYDSYSNPRYDTTDPGHTQGVYSYNVGFSTDILWDDIPIDVGLTNTSVNIQQVQFGIVRAANAPATTIDAYWAPMVADNGATRGGSDPNGATYDGPNEDPGTAVHIGQISLPANGASGTTIPITFGDGVSTLFATGLLNKHYSPSVGYFMLGLQFSDTSTSNAWVIATAPNNLDVVWDDFQDGNPSSIAEFTFGSDNGDALILGTMSAKVIGVVPEPASLSVLALGGLAMVRRRRA